MARLPVLLIALFFFFSSSAFVDQCRVEASFWDSAFFTWGARHSSVLSNGNDVQLVLDKISGSGYYAGITLVKADGPTVNEFRCGANYSESSKRNTGVWICKFSLSIQERLPVWKHRMLIKFVPGNSAGTVTAYYLSSTGPKHDEIDFEFLGNVSGQPYTIHTNIFTQGVGNREQQFYPWFDPSADFHSYTIHWNPTEVVWYVDSIPIRVFRNYQSQGVGYPNQQGMRVYSSLWNAEDWATMGGLVKTDWQHSPFVARFRNFRARACKWFGPASIWQCAAKTPANWYASPAYGQLSSAKQGQMKWARDKYMVYDYCQDTKRFDWKMPPECSKPQY